MIIIIIKRNGKKAYQVRAQPDDLCSILGNHTVEEKNWLPQVVL